MPKVDVMHDNVGLALATLKKKMMELNILKELSAKEFYEKPTAKRKRKKNASIRRHQAIRRDELAALNPPYRHK